MAAPIKQDRNHEPLAWPVAHAAVLLNCGRPAVYRMMARGELDYYMVGSDKRVTTASIKRHVRTDTINHAPREVA